MDEPQSRRDRREKANKVSGDIIDAAVAVHRELGPGLLESVYEQALAFEFSERDMFYERQNPCRFATGILGLMESFGLILWSKDS